VKISHQARKFYCKYRINCASFSIRRASFSEKAGKKCEKVGKNAQKFAKIRRKLAKVSTFRADFFTPLREFVESRDSSLVARRKVGYLLRVGS